MKGKIFLRISGVVVAGLLAIGVVATAFAADPTPTPWAGQRGPMAGAIGSWGGGAGAGSVVQALEKLTGLSATEIQSLRAGGKSAVQIANEKGVSEEALVNEILAARKAALDAAVKANRITQAQADYMLNNMASRVKEGVNRTDVGPRRPISASVGPMRGDQASCPYGQAGQMLGRGRMGR